MCVIQILILCKGFKTRSVEKALHPGKPSKVTVNLTESNNPTENESPKKIGIGKREKGGGRGEGQTGLRQKQWRPGWWLPLGYLLPL